MESWLFILIFICLGAVAYYVMGKIDKFLAGGGFRSDEDGIPPESYFDGKVEEPNVLVLKCKHFFNGISLFFKKRCPFLQKTRPAAAEMSNTKSKFSFLASKPAKVIVYGYIIVIAMGALLLMLPFATRSGVSASFTDALFTATSATCVTGLVVHDTYLYWSQFGQLIILVLIQTGGLGFMTIMMYIFGFTRHKIGLAERSVMQESISAPNLGGIVRMGRFAFYIALSLEAVGAFLLSFKFCPEYGLLKGAYFSVFHSVSAFCNAGFDLMGGTAPFSSLTAYSGNMLVSLTIAALIVFGGLGFVVWDDIIQHKHHFKEYRLHTKIVLSATVILILSGALMFFLFEMNGAAFAGKGLGERVLASFFQSITPRTAGFNTVDLAVLTDPSVLLLISMMIIGGAPGSTAGGIKVTTFSLLVLCVVSVFRKRTSVECFNRRIEDSAFKKAFTVLMIYLLLVITVSTAIAHIDHVSLKTALFEASSAIGTVGLSLGITPQLSVASQLLLAFLMYFGRVGCLTIVYLLIGKVKEQPNHLPTGKIAIG